MPAVTLVVQGDRRAVPVAVTRAPLPPWFRPVQRKRARRSEGFQYDRDQGLAWRFQEACIACGLVVSQASIAAGMKFGVPRVILVSRGEPTVLLVDTLPAQLVTDYSAHAARIASAMSVARVRFEALGPSRMRVELMTTDPLAESVPVGGSLDGVDGLIFLGRDDTGLDYWITPRDLIHLIVQGGTGSGKSVFVYGLLSQLVGIPDVLIAMSDPTGLLARPFAGTAHEEWQVGGTGNVDAHIDLLERLVGEMDQRIETLPPRRDHVEVSEGCPLIIAVLEEYPGLIRAAMAVDGSKKSGGCVERIKSLVGRLAAEARKAEIHLVMLAQRAEATVVDSYTRGQMTVKLSFRVAEASSIEMLHPSGRSCAVDHATAAPGIALLSGPGVPLSRLKTPYIGHGDGDTEYGRYWDLVTERAARLPADWA